jgi:hypothetical protein
MIEWFTRAEKMDTGPFSGCSHKFNFTAPLAVHAPLKIEKLTSDLVSAFLQTRIKNLLDMILAGFF